MVAGFILAALLLHFVVYFESALILILVLLVFRLGTVGMRRVRQRDRARRERDEAKEILAVIRQISKIRCETVARLQGFSQ
ncbi:MAG: hypothetical protein ACRDJ3_00935 [Solirubrobacteraceae bacterium]